MIDCPRLEGAEWQGLLSCLQWKGGKNRRQNLRFFVPHHSPYILHSNGAQTTLSLGQALGTRISSQVGDLPKGEDKITKRDKITCPDKMMAQCGTTLLSGLGGRTWQALVVPTVARKTVTGTSSSSGTSFFPWFAAMAISVDLFIFRTRVELSHRCFMTLDGS